MTVQYNAHPDHPHNDTSGTAKASYSDFHDARDQGSYASTRVVTGGALEFTPGKGVTSRGYASHSTYDDLVQSNDHDVLSTARSTYGTPINGRPLEPTDRVIISGMETTVAMAETMGYLRRNEFGQIVNGMSPAEEKAKQLEASTKAAEVAQREADSKLEGFGDAGAEKALTTLVQATSPSTQISAMADYITHGSPRPETVEAFATQLGLPAEAAKAKLEAAHNAFIAQGTAAVASIGVPDPEAWYAWAEKTHPGELKLAMEQHVRERTTAGYRKLAQSYMERLDTIDPEAILTAELGPGVRVRQDAQGRIVVTVPDGRSMSWAGAVKTGAIKLS